MNWKKLGRKLLFPPVWLQLLLAVACAGALVYIFVSGLEENPIAYAVYVLSFYTLTVICVFCSMVLPRQYRRLRQKVMDIPTANRFLTDRIYRTKVTLLLSLGMNLLYVGVNLVSYLLYRSWWFVCLGIYYAILSLMRYLLARYILHHAIGTDRRGELVWARACSCILLLVNLFLSGAVLMILFFDRGYVYDGILIYVMAAFTFYTTINAVINLVRYKKYGSPVISATKVISLASALVSMLNLETAMFAAFGQNMAKNDQRLMIILTGAGVSVTVIAMSLYMIVKTSKEMKEARSNKNG